MIRVEGQRIIRAPVQRVFQLVSRLDAHPRVTGLWLTADLLERRANGLTVQYRGYLAGIPVESVQQATLQPPHRVEFRQTRGGLKTLRGAYVLNPANGDTELHFTVDLDVGIALISETAARRVFHSYVEQSLDKFKLAAERELPRPRKSGAPSTLPVPSPASIEPLPAPTAPPDAVSEAIAVSQPAAVPKPAAASSSIPPEQGKKRRRRRRRRRGPGGTRGAAGPSSPPGPLPT